MRHAEKIVATSEITFYKNANRHGALIMNNISN